jgi:hypothetical protein
MEDEEVIPDSQDNLVLRETLGQRAKTFSLIFALSPWAYQPMSSKNL